MAKVAVSAERAIDAPADEVYGYLADMHQHPRFLPPAFSDFQVVEGGVGAGTVTQFKVTAGGRTREYRTRITEPEPGKTLVETDTQVEPRHDVQRLPPGRQVAGADQLELGRRGRDRRLLRAHLRPEDAAQDLPR
jgi:uncharacterized protein YndB with AHSA1/START domain